MSEEKRLFPKLKPHYRKEWTPDIEILDSKVVFLNKENLEKLEGYKAIVEYKQLLLRHFGDSYEIHIILTGFSAEGAKRLFDSLKDMRPEEVYGK